jgi:diguanylate cyclase (GGDEF)-like protein/PAS domain S-box-containing protein
MTPQVESGLGSGQARWLWDGGFSLRMSMAAGSGRIVLDRDGSTIAKSLFSISAVGKTGEVSACVNKGESYVCFPNAWHDQPFSVIKNKPPISPFPVERGLIGESGHRRDQDDKGHDVYAVYRPLSSDAGLVVKKDMSEIFEVVRESWALGATVVLGIGLLGALVLFSQLSPLARRMRALESEAVDREEEVRAVLVSVDDAIVTVGKDGLVETFNPSACVMFGYSPDMLKGMKLSALIPERFKQAHHKGMAQYLAGGPPRVIGKGAVELAGLRSDGTEFPLELTVNSVYSTGKRRFVGVMRDITARKLTEEKLERKAFFDELTELPNRAAFKQRLENEVSSAPSSDYAVLFLDLDGFKAVNDELGHRAGDQVLAELARRMKECAGPRDTVGRLAGDEFTMLLTGMDDGELRSCDVAGGIIRAVAEPFEVAGGVAHVTASIGVAIQKPGEARLSATELLHQADQLMYEAKHSGKNQFKMRIQKGALIV